MYRPITDVKMIAGVWRQRNRMTGQMARLLGQSLGVELLVLSDTSGGLVMGASDKVAYASRMNIPGGMGNPKEQLQVLLTACAACPALRSFFKPGETSEFEIHGVRHVYRMHVTTEAT